jgi:hypothetical protein
MKTRQMTFEQNIIYQTRENRTQLSKGLARPDENLGYVYRKEEISKLETS